MHALLAVDDGLIHGKLTFADIMFLIGAVVFAFATIAGYVRQAVPRDWVPVLVPLGLTLISVGWLVL